MRVCTHGDVYSARDQAARTMIRYPTQSYYHNDDISRPFPILVMMNASLGIDKYKFVTSLI